MRTTLADPDPGTGSGRPTLSIFDPIYLGIDEFGAPVYVELIYRNLLAGGEPGGHQEQLIVEAARSTLDELADWTVEADRVLTF
jgi:S-DNA-T family DNA segregation ATPase FtsK/SpoIIIE